jgi:hypothetical protein
MDETTRQKLREAHLKAAEQTGITDDPYETIDLVTHFLEEKFDGEIFDDNTAMEVRINQ